MQRQWCSQETRKPPEGISAAKRLNSIACCDRKAIPIYSNTSRKLSAGRSTLCVRTAEFFLKQKAHRTAIRCAFCIAYYTIPRAIRELWLIRYKRKTWLDYTIPRAIRELWRVIVSRRTLTIIPYQELLGNYDLLAKEFPIKIIIPYQELLGNYDTAIAPGAKNNIIPYQELLGNYDMTTKTAY